LLSLVFCASRRSYTVRHTVEKDRWSAIDSDRSRDAEARIVAFALSVSECAQAPASFTVKRERLYRHAEESELLRLLRDWFLD
jgi:hypothetical protein